MFYSHEILANPQYGVSTIWILATVGNKSVTKKVSKKAIEDVDLARACDKILRPGAPIALRLQAGLLFGVSKVYQRKCQYMLTDVQRIQEHMMSFLRSYGANQVDPSVTRARQVVDSPEFQKVIP
ncbi:R8 protein [Pestalotiopsis sp. IQ-011]